MKLALLLLLVACSGKDHMTSEEMKKPEGSASSPAPTAVETAPKLGDGCAAYAKAQCATMTRCSPHSASLKWTDCTAELERECKLLYGPPGSLVTAAWLRKCAAWSETATCDAFDREGGDCAQPHGQRETGAGCVTNSQCASTYCKKTGRDCGTCVQKPTTSPPEPRGPRLGENCTDSCDDRLHCDKGKCIAPKARALGESCTTDILGSSVGAQPCGAGLSCVGTDKPTCQKRPADGEACTSNGPRCYFPAVCRDGTCKVPDPAACS